MVALLGIWSDTSLALGATRATWFLFDHQRGELRTEPNGFSFVLNLTGREWYGLALMLSGAVQMHSGSSGLMFSAIFLELRQTVSEGHT
jgi:hypothetical protein